MLTSSDFIATHVAYGIYLLVSIGMTAWVARALSSSGRLFLMRCFGQDEALADSTNRLLVIGFYLLNLGFICHRLSGWEVAPIDVVPVVGSRIGLALLVLGGLHFLNMLMIARLGQTVNHWMRAQQRAQATAVPPALREAQP